VMLLLQRLTWFSSDIDIQQCLQRQKTAVSIACVYLRPKSSSENKCGENMHLFILIQIREYKSFLRAKMRKENFYWENNTVKNRILFINNVAKICLKTLSSFAFKP